MPDYRLTRYRGSYAVQWYDEDGRHRITLATNERAEADRLFAEFLDGREAASRPETCTVERAWKGYAGHLGGKPTAVTMGFEWKSIGPYFGARSAGNLSEDDCRGYIEARKSRGRSDGTIRTELSHLRSALKWAEDKRLIDKAPVIYRPAAGAPRDKRMTKSQVVKFIQACDLPHVKLFATLAITTAARMGAILQLTWDRVDLDAGKIIYQDPDRARTNKGRAMAPINSMARAALMEARRGALTPFVIEWGAKPVKNVKKALASAGARAGMPWVTAHVFRHSAGSILAEDGVPLPVIAQLMGHKDVRTTERIYARMSPGYLKEAASALELA